MVGHGCIKRLNSSYGRAAVAFESGGPAEFKSPLGYFENLKRPIVPAWPCEILFITQMDIKLIRKRVYTMFKELKPYKMLMQLGN